MTKEFSYGLQYYFQTHPSTNTGYSLSFGGLSNQATTTTNTSGTHSTTAATGAFPLNMAVLAGTGLGLAWVAGSQDIAVLLSALAV